MRRAVDYKEIKYLFYKSLKINYRYIGFDLFLHKLFSRSENTGQSEADKQYLLRTCRFVVVNTRVFLSTTISDQQYSQRRY